jgi:cell division protein FtsZ
MQNQRVTNTPRPKSPQQEEQDKALLEIVEKYKAVIKVVGCGGGGNNAVHRMYEVGIQDVQTIAINTDAQDLIKVQADTKILIGKDMTRGHGAGSIPKVGEESAREQESEIKQALGHCDMVFITCGLGGGTGTGSAPVVAELARKMGAITIAIVTLPFSMEGSRRMQNALAGLERLRSNCDTLIAIPNDKLMELAPTLPLQMAFKVADEILTNAIKGIAELITKPGLVNLDFADVRSVMSNGGDALISMGESQDANRAQDAVARALTNPLLDIDISGATGALINVAANSQMTLQEAKVVCEHIAKKLKDDARIIWGTQISDDLGKTLRVMIIITGVRTNVPQKHAKDIHNLGIDYVE